MKYDVLRTLPESWQRFYVDRIEMQRSGRFHPRERCWGISSDAMVEHVAGGAPFPRKGQFPADKADLDACQRAYDLAPADMQAAMEPVMVAYRAYVADRYERWAKVWAS